MCDLIDQNLYICVQIYVCFYIPRHLWNTFISETKIRSHPELYYFPYQSFKGNIIQFNSNQKIIMGLHCTF